MVFNQIQINDRVFEAEGQLRIKEDDQVKVIFEDLMLGNTLREMYSKGEEVVYLVLRNSEETRYETKNVSVGHITIDGTHYHATFKQV